MVLIFHRMLCCFNEVEMVDSLDELKSSRSVSGKNFPNFEILDAKRCYCSRVWTMNGGRILWNVSAICETFKISCLMGRHHMKAGSENHSKDP